jgi:2-polyprenyl-6-methoxyphenol hydroxylase-like FAD-dependent oxidoreductase
MQRGALFSILADALGSDVPIHCGRRIVAVSDEGRHVIAADGRSDGPFDLILCADGASSVLRNDVGKQRIDKPYPWGALWCLLAESDWPHANALCQRYRAARQMAGMLPVGTRPDDPTPRVSFFWSLPTREFEHWQASALDAWRDDVTRLWPELRGPLTAVIDARQLARASYRDTVLRSWHRGRLVLVGDAAHAMSPQLGQGVNMALLDAIALRDALRKHPSIEEALAAYQHERQHHVRAYQFWSRWLTPLFQSRNEIAAAVRDIAFAPLGRLWGSRAQMLHVLSGTRVGAFGRLRLPEAFLDALGARQRLG